MLIKQFMIKTNYYLTKIKIYIYSKQMQIVLICAWYSLSQLELKICSGIALVQLDDVTV